MHSYLVFALTVLTVAGAWAARVVLSLYALELGAQPVTIGILAATFSVLPMLLSVTAGRLADRFGSRWLLMLVAAVGASGMLLPYFVPGLPAAFAAAAIIGLSSGTFDVSLQNLVGLLSDPDKRARNFSNYSLMTAAACLIGPLIAGFSIDYSDHATACLYLALLTLVPIPMLAIWSGNLGGAARPGPRAGGSIKGMLSEPGVRRVLAISSLLNAGRDLYRFYLPVYAHAVGLSASTIGILLAMNAAAEFAVRLNLPWLIARFRDEKVLACAFYLGAASLTLVPLFQNVAMLALISFMFGFGMGGGLPIVMMLMFKNAPEGRSGETLGLRLATGHFTRLVGPVVFGAIASTFGLFVMFWVNALMLGSGGRLSRSENRR